MYNLTSVDTIEVPFRSFNMFIPLKYVYPTEIIQSVKQLTLDIHVKLEIQRGFWDWMLV